MSYPMGNVAFAQKKDQQPANAKRGLKVVRETDHVVGEWQLARSDAKAVLTATRQEERSLQVSNPFTREKKEEPVQMPSEHFIC